MYTTILITIDPQNPTLDSPDDRKNCKRDVAIALEPEIWDALHDICLREHSSLHQVCTAVDVLKNPGISLESALYFFVFDYFRQASTEEGHRQAGHGPNRHTHLALSSTFH